MEPDMVWQYEWIRCHPRKQEAGYDNELTVSARTGWEVVTVVHRPFGFLFGWLGSNTWALMRKQVPRPAG